MAIARCYPAGGCRVCGHTAAWRVWLRSETEPGVTRLRMCQRHADEAEASPRFLRKEPLPRERSAA